MIEALDIRVRGIVQGVGFRPFVYRLAKRHLVNGWVLNDLDGVFIHAEAETGLLDGFVNELHMNPPAAAKISEVELAEVPLQDCEGFEIRESESAAADEGTLVSADLGICDDCLRELYDPADRRYRYPFINCTNCGPRFTIIDSLPYDRPATSMAPFEMCGDCAREYDDPADRRFHAQPDACFTCGPQVSFTWLSAPGLPGGGEGCVQKLDFPYGEKLVENLRSLHFALPDAGKGGGCVSEPNLDGANEGAGVVWGADRAASDAVFSACVEVLAAGGILAVKGLGGFHLACDASNTDAIAELRRRKRRDGKAFAVMVADVDSARAACEVSAAEEALLKSAARPIVLLRKRPDAKLAEGLADGLPELGVMLPATPVQSLLIHDFRAVTGCSMLVMTSGNVHDEPIVTDDAEALAKLAGIADAVMGNNRAILSRYDDSVVRVLRLGERDAVQFIRRARGYAPVPIALGSGGDRGFAEQPAVFAAGSEQKNTFTFARAGEAFVSQHIGDMEDADVEDAWFEAKARIERLFDVRSQVFACDAHPDYLASKWVREQASREGAPIIEVQHHHAHIASVLGEHGLYGPCCGIAFDGTGYGVDGAIWGGEVLIANQADYERFANFSYAPMPGAAAAIRHPLRMAYGALWAFDLLEHPGARRALQALGDEAAVCEQMIESGLNTPYTSSVGRLFDAMSALLGICTAPSYEGEAACLLDGARAFAGERAFRAEDARSSGYAVAITKNAASATSTAHDTSVVLLDAAPVFRAALDDVSSGVEPGVVAGRFHAALVDAVVQVAELARAMYDISLVALSGGCFMNRYLVEQSVCELEARGFTVALNANLPPNDGCVSFGQATVACASLERGA